MSERFLLLSSGVCCGLYARQLCIVLNSEGDFVQISHGIHKTTHLTQYVPVAYEHNVLQLIIFRNRYSLMSPVYIDRLCKRFYGSSGIGISHSAQPCRWNLGIREERSFSSTNLSSHVSICQFNKLVVYRGPLYCHNQSCAGDYWPLIEAVFPIKRCPM